MGSMTERNRILWTLLIWNIICGILGKILQKW